MLCSIGSISAYTRHSATRPSLRSKPEGGRKLPRFSRLPFKRACGPAECRRHVALLHRALDLDAVIRDHAEVLDPSGGHLLATRVHGAGGVDETVVLRHQGGEARNVGSIDAGDEAVNQGSRRVHAEFIVPPALRHHREVPYDAILIVSFGGPERREDVIPFLENVLRGRNVPRERLLAVAEHYYHFGGRTPINDYCRGLIDALRAGTTLPIYWGNRNWHPMLADTMSQMKADGVRRAVAIATSAYSSYSSCRQYIEDIVAARAAVGEGAPEIVKLPPFSDHPLFLEANADRVRVALAQIPEDRRRHARLVFTAHSIPRAMADSCRYEDQLVKASCAVAALAGHEEWDLVWQSRSGPPTQPWLEPDILEHLRRLSENGVTDVVVSPIGFLSDHMEVLYDLDVEAKALCETLGLNFVRAGSAGLHPAMVRMFLELIAGPEPAACAPDCCPPPPPARRPA